jgi:hypothetical protein
LTKARQLLLRIGNATTLLNGHALVLRESGQRRCDNRDYDDPHTHERLPNATRFEHKWAPRRAALAEKERKRDSSSNVK